MPSTLLVALAALMLPPASAPAVAPSPGSDASVERHLLYLHGRIVQQKQSARPESPEFGFYEVEAIRDSFRRHGFVVDGGIRPKETTLDEAVPAVGEPVRKRRAEGVPADRIAVVGASRALELSTGLRHGFLYRPIPGWLAPAVEWVRTGTLAAEAGGGGTAES